MQFNMRIRCSPQPEASVKKVTQALRSLAEEIEAGQFRIPQEQNESVQRIITDEEGNEIGQAAFLRLSLLDAELGRTVIRDFK